MVSDLKLRSILINCVQDARDATSELRSLNVRNMGLSHGSTTYRKGWYVFIQNFDSLAQAKASGDDGFFRLNFRIVELRNDASRVLLEILCWHPSHKNASNMILVFQRDLDLDLGISMFKQMMITALLLSKKKKL